MIPDEDVIINHCIVTVHDRSRRFLTGPRQTKYFDVVFYVMYYQIGQSFIGEPVLEITYDVAIEFTKEKYDKMMKEQTDTHTLLRQAKEIINPIYNAKYNE